MLPISDPTCDARLLQVQDHLAEAAANRRAAAARPAPATGTRASAGALARLGASMAALVPDSRDGLRTEEQDLAVWGVRWVADSAHDEELALELQAARARRQAGTAAPAAPAHAAPRTGLRWTIGSVLVRVGQRLEGLPRPATAD
ncbi:MAG: hypothetical protein M3Q03_08815 [Chloroflexota bacterium]|nr:hypothetical protein [Chloroflexota bacterium]